MPHPSLRSGVEATPAEEEAEAGAERDEEADVSVARDVAKPSLRGGTLATGCGGSAFLQD